MGISTGYTALHLAVGMGHNEAVKVLIRAGADLGAMTADSFPKPVLQMAIESKDANSGTLSALLDGGKSIMDIPFGKQALCHAVINGSVQKIQDLLEIGARDDVRKSCGHFLIPRLLSYAVENDKIDALKALLKQPSMYDDDREGTLAKALAVAKSCRQKRMIRFLEAEIKKLPKRPSSGAIMSHQILPVH